LIIGQDGKTVDSKIIAVNPAFENLVGLGKSDIIGHNLFEIIPELNTSNFLFNDNLNVGEITKILFSNSKKNTRNYISASKPVKNKFVTAFFDITDIKINEMNLIKSFSEKPEENRRPNFSLWAELNLEFRTPLNGTICLAELLEDPNLSQYEQKEFIQIIGDNGNRAFNIFDYFLCIAKIQNDQIGINLSDTNFTELVKSVCDFFCSDLRSKSIEFLLINRHDLSDVIIKTDHEKVITIFTKLIEYAIKFSNHGLIQFGFNPKENFVECFVIDDAIGKHNYEKQSLYEWFIEAESLNKRKYSGAGIELSKTESYVKMLGGEIWVESKIGERTTFYFTLPLNKI